jgi:hypothetical protein
MYVCHPSALFALIRLFKFLNVGRISTNLFWEARITSRQSNSTKLYYIL